MRKASSILVLLAMVPFITGGGGGAAPDIPFGFRLAGPRLSAVVVMDPHEIGTTTTAKRATIRVYKGRADAAAVFDVPDTFPLFFGCDTAFTEDRFLNRPLTDWIPANVVETLFGALGLTVTSEYDPYVTKIDADVCTPDANNPGPLTNPDFSSSAPGILSMQATIHFVVPK